MIARERIRQRNRWCRRRQRSMTTQPPKGWQPQPGDDLGCRVCSCSMCDPHKGERKRRLRELRLAQLRVEEELQAEAEIRSEYEAELADGWGNDPWLERPKW